MICFFDVISSSGVLLSYELPVICKKYCFIMEYETINEAAINVKRRCVSKSKKEKKVSNFSYYEYIGIPFFSADCFVHNCHLVRRDWMRNRGNVGVFSGWK